MHFLVFVPQIKHDYNLPANMLNLHKACHVASMVGKEEVNNDSWEEKLKT